MRGLIITSMLLVTGCSWADDSICSSRAAPVRGQGPATNTEDQEQATAHCVDKWATKLAVGPDSAPDVAEAVVRGACDDAIQHLQGLTVPSDDPEQPAADPFARWKDQALFIVIQTRAGNCLVDD